MNAFVTADASPLIGLATAGTLESVRKLFDTVTITRLVKDEILGRGDLPGVSELQAALRAGWLRVAPTPIETWRHAALDAGEASTIALALQHDDALVLMDDLRGCEAAAALGLRVAGVTDVLLLAKRAGHIESVRPVLERLSRRGFTVPEDTLRRVLGDAGELR